MPARRKPGTSSYSGDVSRFTMYILVIWVLCCTYCRTAIRLLTTITSHPRNYRPHAGLYLMERIAAIGLIRQTIHYEQQLQGLGVLLSFECLISCGRSAGSRVRCPLTRLSSSRLPFSGDCYQGRKVGFAYQDTRTRHPTMSIMVISVKVSTQYRLSCGKTFLAHDVILRTQ